ncbi:serine hydrolase [Actinocrispum wychmicini]|uniref:Beta-lactamase n=1 Tax=Actinocrispum wychmicini TaxID=1213861 RepID=A0A4R2IPH3_9PSEU|nr:serine hydrolase [Actinocrispum wychmicini]TCO45929.1 beta-lactamase [Actinocrispum wychmicini]
MPAIETTRLGKTPVGLVRRHGVPAAQLAVHTGGRTVAVAGGDVSADAKFPVGSITKAFTASLAMLQAAEGDLESLFERYQDIAVAADEPVEFQNPAVIVSVKRLPVDLRPR